jgi:exosortase
MRDRGPALIPVLLVILAATALYASIAAGIVHQWFDDSNSSHGILLAAAAAIVVWRVVPALRATPAAPRDEGFAVIGLALLVYVVGFLLGDVFVLRASMPILIAGVVLTLWGVGHTRALLAPIILLALSIPLPAVLVTNLTLPLQLVASQVAAGVLTAVHVPVVRDGNLLALPNITLEVAEACSGLRSVISLVAVAAVCAALIPLSIKRSALLVAAAIPIAVVGNGFRVAATGVLATWFGPIAVRGAIHEATGFVAFLAMCAATIAFLVLTRKGGELVWARQHQ